MDFYDGRITGKIDKCSSSNKLNSKFTCIAMWLESYVAIKTKRRQKNTYYTLCFPVNNAPGIRVEENYKHYQ